MRMLSPACFAASVVLALIGTSVDAATSVVPTPRVSGGTVMTTTTSSRTASEPSAPISTSTSSASSSGTSSTGTSSGSTTTGGATTGSNTATVDTGSAVPNLFANGRASGVVVIDNGTAGVVDGVNANGERVGGQVVAEALSGLSPNALPENTDLVVTRSASAVILPELSAVERKELRKRHNVGKNQQLLNTIAPRTNVDRTRQMPDDPPTPALTTSR